MIKGKDDYCLAVKGNQGQLSEDIALYFDDDKLLDKLAKKSQHCQTIEEARGQIETRNYWISY